MYKEHLILLIIGAYVLKEIKYRPKLLKNPLFRRVLG
jgi:hypothetical protein